MHQMYVIKQKIKIKSQKACQWSTASYPYNINTFRFEDCLHSQFKGTVVYMLHCQLDLINIRMQHRIQNLRLGNPAVSHFHPLYGVQLIPHQLL